MCHVLDRNRAGIKPPMVSSELTTLIVPKQPATTYLGKIKSELSEGRPVDFLLRQAFGSELLITLVTPLGRPSKIHPRIQGASWEGLQ